MKKIILGCAAVLLSLGLLAGCNNKEDEPPITEAVSLSVSQTSVNLEPGGSAEVTYTVDPAEATVMALSDHEEYVTAVAQEGTIYLEAVAAGTAIVSVGAEYEDYASAQAQITVTVAEVLEPEPVVPTVSLTLTKSTLSLTLAEEPATDEPVKIEYEVTPEEAEVKMEVTEGESYITLTSPEEALEQELEEAWYVTPVEAGSATIAVTAEYEGYKSAEATIAVTVHEAGYVAPTEVTGLVLSIELTYDSTNPYTLPEWLDLYVLGEWTCAGLDSLDTAAKLQFNESTDAYEITISETLDIGEWYNYDLFAVYNTGVSENTVAWDHKINDSHEYFQVPEESVTGDVISNPYTLPEGFEEKYPDPNAEGTVQQQTNHKINFYFVDDVSSRGTYYEIPSYADGYLCGYFVSGTWTDYYIGGDTKLVANDTSAEAGYSVTLGTVDTGSITINIYFEFNSGASQHTPPTTGDKGAYESSHSVFGSGNGTITIDNTANADHSDVYLACNPSEIIVDDAAQTSVTLAINDTASTKAEKTLYCSGTMNSWNNSNQMTYDAEGTDYQYSYTFNVDQGSELKFGIFNESNWSDALQVTSNTEQYWNDSNNVVIAGSVITGDEVLILFTADCTNFGTTTHVTATSVTITYAS